jgi:ATP-dependent DNA helicase DinG
MDVEKTIKRIFGPGGTLAKAIPGYEHRPQQTEMALGVYEALVSGNRLIVEAPTGTGKTLAYLIAAALSRKRVAISTGTKNLQEQLFFKDIPLVCEKIFPQLKAALLKGRANFVCHHRFQRFLSQPYLQGVSELESLQRLLPWYRKTCKHGQGDRAELEDLPDDDPVWPEICSGSETCLGRKCPHRERCFVLGMRSRAQDVDLMIVNHHLLISDLAVKESGFGAVIPRYEALIVDEAHGLEEAATQHFGFQTSFFRIIRLVRDTTAEIRSASLDATQFKDLFTSLEESGRQLFSALAAEIVQRARLEDLDPQLAGLRDLLTTNLERLATRLAALPQKSEELEALAVRAKEIRKELEIILADDPSPDFACWAEPRNGWLILHASPVDVGDALKSRLYSHVGPVVFTSATLSSNDNFDYVKSRLGLDGDPRPSEAILDSPFDFSDQTILYVPRSVPEPNSPGFTAALEPILLDLLERTQGRAFVLCTSYRNMEDLYRRIEGQVSFPLLIQGSKPKGRLLNEFRERQGSVLFATASFWEGVDVKGEALSCVIVDRLPFAHPDEPVVAARIEKIRKSGEDPFHTFQVPMAVIALKQGLGRLIRTRSDRGVLCVLDVRLLTKGYGRIFRKSLHTGPLVRDPKAVSEFFEESGDQRYRAGIGGEGD